MLTFKDERIVVAILVATGSVAIASIVISTVTLAMLGKPDVYIQQTGVSTESVDSPVAVFVDQRGNIRTAGARRKIYLLSIGHDATSHEYFDDEGYLQGFGLMLSQLVCQEARVDCRLVWSRYEDCWDSQKQMHATGGKALHGKWVDTCVGWYTTHERLHVFQMGQPYMQLPRTFLYYKPGSNFNSRDLTGKKIGFLEGWATDDKCLARRHDITGSLLNHRQIDYSYTTNIAMDKLEKGQIDAIFTIEGSLYNYRSHHVTFDKDLAMSCVLSGVTVMSRKDSEFPQIWNAGYNKARSNGRFFDLCERAKLEHGHKGEISCIEY